MTTEQIRETVWTTIWQVYGHAPTAADYSYWVDQGKFQECLDRGIEINDPDYAVKRLQGWQSTGSDVPPYGPYANPPKPLFGPVPPYPSSTVPNGSGSTIPPEGDPTPSQTGDPASQGILEALKGIQATLDLLIGRPAPSYSASLGPFGTIVLHPMVDKQ